MMVRMGMVVIRFTGPVDVVVIMSIIIIMNAAIEMLMMMMLLLMVHAGSTESVLLVLTKS